VLSAADTACFLAKDKGRNQVQVFQMEDEEVASRKCELDWVSEITRSLAEDRFFLDCQRVDSTVERRGGRTEYLELLLRMRHKDGSVISPKSFIPAAERYSLMPDIDRWVVRKTLQMLSDFQPTVESRFAINLSGRTLSDAGFLDFLLGCITESSVPAELLVFEITETAAVAHLGQAALLIRALKDKGARFALDDFGAGLSSFAYLRTLPVDYVKIDGVFVRNAVRDPIDYAMVESIRRLADVMGIQTVAESVETVEGYACMRSLGVDFVQGYHVHVPEYYHDWLAKHSAASAIVVG